MSPRSVAVVLAELAEVRRHLHDAPPHAGSGVRRSLEERAAELERELAARRRERAADGGDENR